MSKNIAEVSASSYISKNNSLMDDLETFERGGSIDACVGTSVQSEKEPKNRLETPSEEDTSSDDES